MSLGITFFMKTLSHTRETFSSIVIKVNFYTPFISLSFHILKNCRNMSCCSVMSCNHIFLSFICGRYWLPMRFTSALTGGTINDPDFALAIVLSDDGNHATGNNIALNVTVDTDDMSKLYSGIEAGDTVSLRVIGKV